MLEDISAKIKAMLESKGKSYIYFNNFLNRA